MPTHAPLLSDDARALVTAASTAPSIYNTQPWRFVVRESTVDLHGDQERQLAHGDPEGRSLHLSCGAALFTLRVAADHFGYAHRVEVLPDPDDRWHLARLEVLHRSTPRLPLAPFYAAVFERHTNREPFLDRPVPPAVLAQLQEDATAEGATLVVHTDPTEITRIVGLLHDAERQEHLDPATVSERALWITEEPEEEGVPAIALGPVPADRRTPFRDLGDTSGAPRALRSAIPRETAQFEAQPVIAVLSTRRDDPAAWLAAGQALQRVLLRATQHGLAASFLNQPLEQRSLRWLVRSPLTGSGQSQMVLRLGYGPKVAGTRRRDASTVTSPAAGAPE